MNRRQKIVLSVTGIFLVLLILIGLTYAYFLTRINGNPNDTSISVTTANLAVTYSDNSSELITSTEPIVPGEFTASKTFTVTNTGNSDAEYVVVLENMKVVYATTSGTQTKDAETSFVYPEDFRYTLTCTNSDGSTCNNIQETGFPINGGVMVGNIIAKDDVQTYTLTLTYLDTGYDQSVDMNKKITGKINIYDARNVNPYANDTTLLANRIITNALNVTDTQKTLGYAEFMPTPLTTPAVEVNGENESTLSLTTDELGTTYYYRGDVKNNYINFNDMCWRIVRIEGDGSIKLILENEYYSCEELTDELFMDEDARVSDSLIRVGVGYIENTNGQRFIDYENSNGTTASLNEWLIGTLSDGTQRFSDENQEKIKSTRICVGNAIKSYDTNGNLLTNEERENRIINNESFLYKTGLRLSGNNKYATYMCDENGKTENAYKIYELTADEYVFAGHKYLSSISSNYLSNNSSSLGWTTVSPFGFDPNNEGDMIFFIGSSSYLGIMDVGGYFIAESTGARPAISILSSHTLYNDGDGTRLNPYTLK